METVARFTRGRFFMPTLQSQRLEEQHGWQIVDVGSHVDLPSQRLEAIGSRVNFSSSVSCKRVHRSLANHAGARFRLDKPQACAFIAYLMVLGAPQQQASQTFLPLSTAS